MAAVVLISIYVASTVFIALGGLIYLGFPGIPQVLKDALLYGKSRGKRIDWTWVQLLECPKRWFLHFYIAGMLANGFVLYMIVYAYIMGQQPPECFLNTVNYFRTKHEVHTGAISAILLVMMMFVQNVRRTLECLFISVYSSSTMNVVHLSLGYYLYCTWGIVVLTEAPDLATYRIHDLHEELHNPLHLVGLLMFIVASSYHHKVHNIFANLRKDSTGAVTSYQHRIPKGGSFEWVSCPHYMFECVIYIAFAVVSGFHHRAVWSVVAFVLVNQIIAALISHKWYKTQFKSYPIERKAIIPLVL